MAEKSRSGKADKGPPAFLKKTYNMVDDAATNDIVSWSSKGDSFVIWKEPEFRLLLPKFFNHCNFSSFVRQLNTYGFRKVVGAESCEFSNEGFQRGQSHLLQGIQRRAPEKQSAVADQEAEIQRLRQENSSLRQERDKLKGKVWNLEQRIRLQELENCKLLQCTKNRTQESTPEAESSQSNSPHFDLQNLGLTESVNRVDSLEQYTSDTSLKSSCLELLRSSPFESPIPGSPHKDLQIPGSTRFVNGVDSPEPHTSEASVKSSCLDLLRSLPCESPRLNSLGKDLQILGLTEIGNQVYCPELCTSRGSVKSSCLDLFLSPPCQLPPIRNALHSPNTVGSMELTNRAATPASSEELETEMVEKNTVFWQQMLTETPDTVHFSYPRKKVKKAPQ